MSGYAIEVSQLGKRYFIGPMPTFGSRVRQWLRHGIARHEHVNGSRTEFWALRDVSFAIEKGEVVGVVGRNGAGKSTLLKILSRITSPTEGSATIRGRVGALLEVGSGFHPMLSGRENIYLKGVTLGLTHREIHARFDEIVEFSEVGRFIDTPVKHYSSGMFMRLAFSVAAHLLADVVLLDEVLAVGDAEFQKKCLGKVDELTARGRTVLFVSHNPAAVLKHCTRTMWLDQGRIREFGETSSVLNAYLGQVQNKSLCYHQEYALEPNAPMQLTKLTLQPPAHPAGFRTDEPMDFEVELVTRKVMQHAYVALGIRTPDDDLVYWTADLDTPRYASPQVGVTHLRCRLPQRLLTPGNYSASVGIVMLGRAPIFHKRDQRIRFEVVDHDSLLASHGVKHPGYCAIPSQWISEELSPLMSNEPAWERAAAS